MTTSIFLSTQLKATLLGCLWELERLPVPANVKKMEHTQKLLEKQQEDLDKEKIRDLKIVIEYFDDIIKSNEPNRYILESRL